MNKVVYLNRKLRGYYKLKMNCKKWIKLVVIVKINFYYLIFYIL